MRWASRRSSWRSPAAPRPPRRARAGRPAAARQEGKLVLASSPNPDTRVQLPQAFKERFGVEIEYLGGRSSDLQTRLGSERASGVYSVDVIIGGGDTVTAMYND